MYSSNSFRFVSHDLMVIIILNLVIVVIAMVVSFMSALIRVNYTGLVFVIKEWILANMVVVLGGDWPSVDVKEFSE